MSLLKYSGIAAGLAALLLGAPALAASGKTGPMKQSIKGHPLDELFSGYYFASKETQAIQDDDFGNPAMTWYDIGEANWSNKDGKAGKACANCHKVSDLKGVAASYPAYDKKLKKLVNVEDRINNCRKTNMQAKPWKYDSNEMLGMTIFVKAQSRGMTVAPKIDGPAAAYFEKGKKFYYQRRGQLDMSCANCHEDFAGGIIRANLLTQGQSNGFPVYRLKWQKPGSIHRRFRGCNKQVRAKPYGYGSDEYVNLELFVAWRGRGLPVETPAVRN